MQLRIDPNGAIHCIYDEAIDLSALGSVAIPRQPRRTGRNWWADLSPVGGPTLGPFDRRGQALREERLWLETHWLIAPKTPRD